MKKTEESRGGEIHCPGSANFDAVQAAQKQNKKYFALYNVKR